VRVSSQRSIDAGDSLEGLPASTASTLMSSSTSGQWMPVPAPISSQRCLSTALACVRRGYHETGTLMTRPSRNVIESVWSVTCTFVANADAILLVEVVIPSLDELYAIGPDDTPHHVHFGTGKSVLVCQLHGRKPELCNRIIASDVDVARFNTIA
jgi:hypothetical protein